MPEKPYFPIPPLSPLKPVVWIGSARADPQALPGDVRKTLGYAVYELQRGKFPAGTKRLKGELRGLLELRDDFDGDTYRAVCTIELAGVVYVLHVFQKKSTHGISLPKRDLAVIRARWQRAKADFKAQERHEDQTR